MPTRRRDSPGESCRPIAQKRHGNEHRTGRDVAEGDRRGEILHTDPPGLGHRDPLDERQRRPAPSESQQTNQHAAGEQV